MFLIIVLVTMHDAYSSSYLKLAIHIYFDDYKLEVDLYIEKI